MHAIAFLHDLATVMLAAGVVIVLFRLLRQPVVLGYIAAGVLIGPHTPPYSLVTDEATINTLSELGIVFLLFSLGLEFSLRHLRQVGITALVAALTGVVAMLGLGYALGIGFGWRAMDAIFLGAILAISSTTITVKALQELGLKKQHFARVVFGVLIVEDVLAIGMIALLSGIAANGAVEGAQVLDTLGTLTVFLVAALVLGILIVPRLLDFIARFQSNEVLLVAVLGLLFGFCLIVARMNYSVALGAFVTGVVIAEAQCLPRIERLIAPLRDMFCAIFFVAIGLMLDPRVLLDYAAPIAAITAALLFGKVLARGFGAYAAGQDGRNSLRIGMSLAQIGEFSFIIAALGASLRATSDFLYPIAVAVCAVTTLLTPYMIRAADPLAVRLRAVLPESLMHTLRLYTEWLQSLRLQGDSAAIAAMVRRILMQTFVNYCLVIAIFGIGAYAASARGLDLTRWLPNPRVANAVIWGAALVLSLPFLIAAYRKLKALSMLLAEAGVHAGRYTQSARRIVSEVLPVVSIAVMFLLVCALSSSILPPAELLIATLGVGALILALLWRVMVKLHSRLQIALLETLHAEKKSQVQ